MSYVESTTEHLATEGSGNGCTPSVAGGEPNTCGERGGRAAVPLTTKQQATALHGKEKSCSQITKPEAPRISCGEPREHDTVPYQLHKMDTWAGLGYSSLRELERIQREQGTALHNTLACLHRELQAMATRVWHLERELRELRAQGSPKEPN